MKYTEEQIKQLTRLRSRALEAIEVLGISKKDIAKIMGVSYQTLYKRLADPTAGHYMELKINFVKQLEHHANRVKEARTQMMLNVGKK